MRPPTRRRPRGFTLIELMVAVVVAGILAAVAYPAMTAFVKRSRRADAVAALTAIVQAQERYRSNHAAYASDVNTLFTNFNQGNKYYEVALAGLGESASFVGGYTATATPKSGTSQTSDADCTSLSVKLDGSLFTYSASGSGNRDTSNICWSR